MSVELNEWKFATEDRCPEIGFDCIPPSACARHPNTGRNYCCNADVEGICWNQGNAGEDNEVTKACSTAEDLKGWRCMRGSEECVRGGKINLCTLPRKEAENPLPEIGSSVLEEMYSSLSVSAPSETYLSFDPSALIAATQTSSSTAASTTASTESTTADAASATAVVTNTTEPESGLGGGAIGGIVAGVVVGVALLGLGAWYLLRKKRRERVPKVDSLGETKSDADHQIRDRQMAELGSRELQELP
ncbi:uncharacterized protein NECHADRAFT_83089 [Fusarium vanettenii 77-13-4]|uniref:Extracellular membrane protein CFEM domain-containing protein n=1 Tax=Fusarium vanettenii (strain ATCC MYA-4622 / CBS 123669 / FGSC 9596 / NRRL 45880 / 77-13-4) TaxID=660122 RepID=C7ZBB6_FUSV7|nr:uncharacterized protein NECHADRAFT_83089 [Fusarium vanettenii 77-13-4]EEU38816.1 hypothetical protein NECHADRAFT_83089 [Fusarium vanettenii 77-13-4]